MIHAIGRLLTSTAAAVLLLTDFLVAQQPETMVVTAESVNLRTAPSIDSSIVRRLAKGSLVMVLGREGMWIRVQAGSVAGWVRSSQLGAATEAPQAPPSSVPKAPLPTGTSPPPRRSERPAPDSQPAGGRALSLFGGLARSTVSFGTSTSQRAYGNHVGFVGGLGISLGGKVGFELDATFVHKGVVVPLAGGTQTINTAYVEVPVVLRLQLRGRSPGVFIIVGPEGGYEVSCKETNASGGVVESLACGDDSNFDGHPKLDFGVIGGLDLRLGRLTAQARYDLGLRNLYSDGQAPGKNRSVMLLGGISF